MSRRPSVSQPFRGQRDPATGRALCCWCGKVVPPRAVRWCGAECVARYRIAKGDQGAARHFLRYGFDDPARLRHNSPLQCAICALDLSEHAIEARLRQAEADGAARWMRQVRDLTGWDADHTIPIVEGGPLTPENLRVLCKPCHRRETAALRQRMAERRRAAKSSEVTA